MKVRAHMIVSGMVQGVFFRARTMNRAVNLGVNGWIRNLSDGRVEAVFEGEEEGVSSLVEFCRHGPSSAVVTNVELTWENYSGELREFKIRH